MKSKHTTWIFAAVFIILIAVLLFFMLGGKSTYVKKTDASGLEGNIRVSGAFALYPMMVKWAEEFNKIHPNVKIDVSAGGAGKGVADTLSGLVDIGMVSRDISQEEIDKGAYYVPVVKDAVFTAISKENPVADLILEKGLKKSDFVGIWMNDTNLSWGNLVGTNESTKVNVYTRSDSCGAAETWAKYLGGKQEDL